MAQCIPVTAELFDIFRLFVYIGTLQNTWSDPYLNSDIILFFPTVYWRRHPLQNDRENAYNKQVFSNCSLLSKQLCMGLYKQLTVKHRYIMKLKIRTLLAAILSLSCLTALSEEELTARQIIEKQKTRQACDTEYGQELMMIQHLDSDTREKREVRRYAKKSEGLSRALIAFCAPKDIEGTAILTWEQDDRDDDQWIYLPASGSMQRIGSSSRKNYFMGTDFTYEDIQPEEVDQFTYTVVQTDVIQIDEKDCECWRIEVVPANTEIKKKSGYSKRLLWIEKERFITPKIEFYDRRKRLIKTQQSFEFEHIEGTIWRPRKVQMSNPSKSSQTLALTTLRKINEPIDDDVFTERFVLSGKYND